MEKKEAVREFCLTMAVGVLNENTKRPIEIKELIEAAEELEKYIEK